ncbi:GNAT family N-acetyltransferase [Emcibacter nanhaiensis]|uniref:GNAT family N-acetyltransferase n=1 Tax=Emcibacter nanhaiensis TaxID=1505037 RepID=A0A501PNU8_9PROT|nr:GNAT family N-acetyltransferase [Emcibacter nanhaiensis]TPD61797.1 GNAT family N-acetyltransferase [Emcibacter nanhaiensis]
MKDREAYQYSFDKERLQPDVIHGFLTQSYWADGIPLDTVQKCIDGSLCIGVYDSDGVQAGFARVVTDRASFAYLADVFVLPDYQGQGLARELVSRLRAHPELQGLRRWMLATRDAHGVYARLGFEPVQNPDIFMEINVPDIYKS